MDPNSVSVLEKNDDITGWPMVYIGKIFQYILSKRDFNMDYVGTLGRYNDEKAYSYFDSVFNQHSSVSFCLGKFMPAHLFYMAALNDFLYFPSAVITPANTATRIFPIFTTQYDL